MHDVSDSKAFEKSVCGLFRLEVCECYEFLLSLNWRVEIRIFFLGCVNCLLGIWDSVVEKNAKQNASPSATHYALHLFFTRIFYSPVFSKTTGIDTHCVPFITSFIYNNAILRIVIIFLYLRISSSRRTVSLAVMNGSNPKQCR